MKLFIITAKGKQFVVPAAFNNAAFVHHNYFVRALDGTEAVGNRYGGTGTHEPVEGILHAALGFGVKRGRGFVQDQDGRVLEDGAGDADTLPLAAAELDAAVTYVGVVAVLFLHYELMGVRYTGRSFHGSAVGIFYAEGYIVENGVVEQYGILVHIANQAAQVTQRQVPYVDAVDGYAA